MSATPRPIDEDRRLAALRALRVLDTEAEPAFDAIVRMVSRAFGAPIALVSLLDERRQWFKARVGLDVSETPRKQAFCNYTIQGTSPLVVPDATKDPRFAESALVTEEPFVRSYLGAPLISAEGDVYGALCAMDSTPVDWTREQIAMLQDLAEVVVELLSSRRSAEDEAKRRRLLADAHHSLKQVAKLAGVGGWEFEPESGRLLWSAETRRIYEVSEHFQPTLEDVIELFPHETRPKIAQAVERCAREGVPFDVKSPCRTSKGKRIHVRVLGERVLEPGRPMRLRGSLQDITRQREREEALRRAQEEASAARERLWNAIEAIPDGFVIYDAEDRLVAANRVYHEFYAKSADAIRIGARLEDILRHGLERGQYPDAIGREEQWLKKRLERYRRPSEAIEQRIHPDRWVRIQERQCENGDVVGFRVDITENKRAEERLRRYSAQLREEKALSERRNRELLDANAKIARHALEDPLTRLPNRRRLGQAFAEFAARGAETGEAIALLHVDLDHFKEINDSLGHAAGDEALRIAAERLLAAVRRGDLTVRLGGDEFVVLGHLPAATDDADGRSAQEREAHCIAERIVAALSRPVDIEGRQVVFGASVGSAVARRPDVELDLLLRAADIALYKAKQAGRGMAMRFEASMLEDADVVDAQREALEALSPAAASRPVPSAAPACGAG